MLIVSVAPGWRCYSLLVIKVLEWLCRPRHADRGCCAGLAMLLLVVTMLVCWCRPRHADRECCAVLVMLLLLVMMVLVC
jgi:hypothetical protein